MPWDDLLALGLGVIGWDPGTFWDSSYTELMYAFDGYRAKNGIEDDQGPPSASDFQHLIDRDK
jgi:hypothetical protein